MYLAPTPSPILHALQELIDVVAHLRDPAQGCPWDLAQTPESLTPYVIEEAYEVVDAIRQNDVEAIAEELGDLLLQVVLQSQIAQEAQQFTLGDVATGITNKLIRRHPHVFADGEADTPEAVRQQWDAIKAEEQGETNSTLLSKKLGRYARTLPPLMAGLKIGEKASASGLDWPNISGAWEKFYEELAEFQEALLKGDVNQQQSELGDLLFAVINLARWCHLHPVTALQDSYGRFIRRLEVIEGAIAQPLEQYSLEELDNFWQQAKAQLRQTDPNA
ncbi:nucleoside triphosphate pyrophosphohydrolase [Candidatus Synechococcus calcipolaris G9]|uniref:Nucleoside triphosphate pyrophosphohydrolase n=1 Tax=Candidatus Synechococcus calcipolaris G9 TaxID=1497997 RepID=A0ABT6EXU1_9SYNE|nr:nucleoside triphosphate pyrophosphohydrolase [Candidatus Synechococcus calcipolaris G9]